MSAGRRVVVSLRSHHANRVYAGTKQYEFRRVGAGFAPGDEILIYETAPVSLITGTAQIDHVLRDVEGLNTGGPTRLGDAYLPEALVGLESDPHERAHIGRYLNGARRPVALRLVNVLRLAEPWPLSRVGLSRAPQSYQFLGA